MVAEYDVIYDDTNAITEVNPLVLVQLISVSLFCLIPNLGCLLHLGYKHLHKGGKGRGNDDHIYNQFILYYLL